MSASGTGAIFEYGLNTSGSLGQAPATWYRARLMSVSPSPNQDIRPIPLENGVYTTPGMYKGLSFFGGQTQINPRMNSDFGWLLLALLGSDTITGPTDAAYKHSFKMGANQGALVYMGMRTSIPNSATGVTTITGSDCILNNAAFTWPQGGIITAQLGFQGLDYTAGSAAFATLTPEDFTTVPLSVSGSVMISGSAAAVTSVGVTFTNNTTSAQQEQVVGSYKADEFTMLSRTASIQATLKWKNSDMYRRILMGGVSGTTFSPTVYTQSFLCTANSPTLIGAGATPYGIEISANKVSWAVDAIELQAGELIQMRLQGTVVDDPTNFLTIAMTNARATAYSLP